MYIHRYAHMYMYVHKIMSELHNNVQVYSQCTQHIHCTFTTSFVRVCYFTTDYFTHHFHVFLDGFQFREDFLFDIVPTFTHRLGLCEVIDVLKSATRLISGLRDNVFGLFVILKYKRGILIIAESCSIYRYKHACDVMMTS